MAAISYVSKEQAPTELQPTYEQLEKRLGNVLNIFRAMAHNPELLLRFLALDAAAGDTMLDPRLRDLAYLKVSEINKCAY